jgi:hypothetical protein
MPRVRPLALIAVAVAVVTGATACAAPDDERAPRTFPTGVSVEFVQLRSDVADRQAQVRVHNDTGATIEIGAVTVTDPRFAEAATRVNPDRVSMISPGRAVDIRIQLPPMKCDTADGSTTVRLIDESSGSTAEGPLPDPLDVIAPLHERECRAEQVRDAAALSFSSFTPSPPGEPAVLTLSVVPTGEAAVTIVGIQTTNLLTFDAGPGATGDTYPIGFVVDPATGAGVEPVRFDLPLVPLRCDAHAVQEDKRGTVFTLEVEVGPSTGSGTGGGGSGTGGGGSATGGGGSGTGGGGSGTGGGGSGTGGGTIELPAGEAMRGRMLTWVADWCGFGR